MRELIIVFSEGCLGSQQLAGLIQTIDWKSLGIVVSWIPFDRRDPRVRSAGIIATPTGILDGMVLFHGAPDRATLLRKLGAGA